MRSSSPLGCGILDMGQSDRTDAGRRVISLRPWWLPPCHHPSTWTLREEALSPPGLLPFLRHRRRIAEDREDLTRLCSLTLGQTLREALAANSSMVRSLIHFSFGAFELGRQLSDEVGRNIPTDYKSYSIKQMDLVAVGLNSHPVRPCACQPYRRAAWSSYGCLSDSTELSTPEVSQWIGCLLSGPFC
jgi:hypothetical protein